MTVGNLTTSPNAAGGRLARIALGGRVGREFAKLWCASAVSGAGDGTALIAAPLLAFSLTRDPRLIAGVTTALTLPYLLFSLPAGVIIDRVDRRRAMAYVDAFRAVLLAGFTVLVITHVVGILELYACFFLIGTCETFFRNSSQTLIPQVVERDALPLANSRMMGAEIVMNEFVGPMTGGLLFAIAPPVPFGIDAASFAVSSTLLSRLRPPPELQQPRTGPRPPISPRAMAGELKAGLRVLWRHRILRNMALIAGVTNLVTYGILGVLVVYARENLHVSKTGYGLLLGAAAIGGLIASRIGPAVLRKLGREWTLLLAIVLQAGAYLAIFLITQPLLFAAMLAVASLGLVQWNVVAILLRQTMVPHEMLGRVNGVYRFIAWGTLPLGAISGGLLAGAFGVRSVFSTAAVALGLVLIYVVRVTVRREITAAESSQATAEPAPVAAEPGPAVNPDPAAETDPAGEPDPTAETDPAGEPDPTAETDPAGEPDPQVAP
jgi:MFS family permease